MTYNEWQNTSPAYRAYVEASERCAKEFAPRVEAELNQWVHPRTGQTRRYVNNLEALIGLETSHYNTGNIAGAWLDGEVISNSQAYKIRSMIGQMKVWVDAEGTIHWYKVNSSNRHLDCADVIEAVKAAL